MNNQRIVVSLNLKRTIKIMKLTVWLLPPMRKLLL